MLDKKYNRVIKTISTRRGADRMNTIGLILLTLPNILHLKGPKAILVFLIMNSIIHLLMEYNRIYIQILGGIIEDGDQYIRQGLSYEESFEKIVENVNLEVLEAYVPRGMNIVISISSIISLVAIIIGIVNLLR